MSFVTDRAGCATISSWADARAEMFPLASQRSCAWSVGLGHLVSLGRLANPSAGRIAGSSTRLSGFRLSEPPASLGRVPLAAVPGPAFRDRF